MKILYVQTDVDEDLLGTFLLFPFWWISGLNIYIFQCVAGFVFIKLLMRSIQTGTVLSIATPCFWFAVFLVIYFVSLVVNASYYPLQRVLASLNNYAIFMMGFLMVLTLCNCADERYLKRFMAVCHWLCLVTGILAILFWGFGVSL